MAHSVKCSVCGEVVPGYFACEYRTKIYCHDCQLATNLSGDYPRREQYRPADEAMNWDRYNEFPNPKGMTGLSHYNRTRKPSTGKAILDCSIPPLAMRVGVE